jgi:hypothetical protein
MFSKLIRDNRGLLTTSIVLTSIIGASPATAASINGLFTTGVDNNGNVLPLGASDPHYTVVEAGNANAFVVSDVRPNYVPNNSTSQWIWEQSNGRPTNVTRTLRTTFDLTGLNPNTASISGLWGADDLGIDILINGLSTVNTSPGFSDPNFSFFNIDSGFVAGLNTLDFVVQDVGVVSAFRVAEISGTADAVPEPFTILGSVTALGFGTLFKRESSKKKNKS